MAAWTTSELLVIMLSSKSGRRRLTLVIYYYRDQLLIIKRMQHAKTLIVETERANRARYYFSVAEKENNSGILFNERLFFLLSGQHIGYMSQVHLHQRPEDVDFQKAKQTVLLKNIKSVGVDDKQIVIKYKVIEGTKMSERVWIFRFANGSLSRKWYELVQKEKQDCMQQKQRKKEQVEENIRPQAIEAIIQTEKKPLGIVSQNMSLSQNLKMQKQTREMGTNVSPKNSDMARSRQKYNYYQELAKVMSEGSPRPSPPPTAREIQSQQARRTQKKDLEAQYRVDQNLSQRLLDISKGSNQRSSSSGNLNNSSIKPRFQFPEWRVEEQSDLSPINKLDRRKYFQAKPSPPKSSGDDGYYLRTNRLIKNSPVEDYLGVKMPSPRQLEEVIAGTQKTQRDTQMSPSFQKYSQKVNRRLFPIEPRVRLKSDGIPWTFKYVKHKHLMYGEFKRYTEQLLVELISDMCIPAESKRFKMKLLKNNIAYYDVDDVEVKIALIALQRDREDGNSERGSNKIGIKMLQNEFNNYKAMHQYLGDSVQLRVPLVSICEFQGFVGFFKILSRNCQRFVRNKDIQGQIQELKKRSKIDCNFSENIHRVIIELDSNYYDQFKVTGEDDKLNFRLFFIQEVDHYLLPDVVADKKEGVMILRKELIDNYKFQMGTIKSASARRLFDPFEQRERASELLNLSKAVMRQMENAIEQLDSLSVYFMTSHQLSVYLHSKGINMRYLGYLHDHLKTTFQRRIVMSEIAVRSCKLLLRKTVQDLLLQQNYLANESDFKSKLCDFLNCVLGKSFETGEIWKVISAHALLCFGLALNLSEIDRWYFLISLVQNCRLMVDWERISIEDAFRTDAFFNEKNLVGLAFHHKIYEPIYCEFYNLAMSIIEGQESREGFDKLVSYLNLDRKSIPQHLDTIKPQINKYLAYFISPEKASQGEYKHLQIYSPSKQYPSRIDFEIKLIEIKWHLKLKKKELYIKGCNDFLKMATQFYGEFHPIFSQLYDVFSTYHMSNFQLEDSITFAKSSLVNVLKICGTNHQKTSEAYYHLAYCYIKAGRQTEATSHLQKSKLFFQASRQTDTPGYGVMCLKLGLMYLNQNQADRAIKETTVALKILQRQNKEDGGYENEMTECFQIMARCYEILGMKEEIKHLSGSCLYLLRSVSKAENMQRLLKIYLYPILSAMNAHKAASLMEIISLLPLQIDESMYQTSFRLLKQRLSEDSFGDNLSAYLQKVVDIETHLREKQVLRSENCFGGEYPRQTVKDFLALVSKLVVLLGQGYLLGSLRESL